MNIRKLAVAALAAAIMIGSPFESEARLKSNKSKKRPAIEKDMDSFITDLMSKMTVEEKIGQTNLLATGEIVTGEARSSNVGQAIRAGNVGGVFNLTGADRLRELQTIAVEESRLGIPMIFGLDVIHGYETSFTVPLGLACTWDIEGIGRSASVAAKEASADGICWTFSPMTDICRDARWGRIAEGCGEDPYLGSLISASMVRGYQGNLSSDTTIMACLKHFALYGASESGRDYNTVDMSRWRMFNEYFPPYKAAVDAGVGSVMASFNIVDGIPATGNKWLLTDVLRKRWKFDGFVVTDYGGIAEMTPHGMGNLQTVSALAMNAGVDMDMMSFGFLQTIGKALESGEVSMETLDRACRYVLEAKWKLGLFHDPYKYLDPKRAKSDILTPANIAESRRLSQESIVLLKNEGGLLPLKRKQKVALIGPMADDAINMGGCWWVGNHKRLPSTILEGIRRALGSEGEVAFAKGSHLYYDARLEENALAFGHGSRDPRSDAEMLAEAMRVAAGADVIVAALGESAEMTGEAASRSDITIPDAQRDLLDSLLTLGKPVVLLNLSGRPMAIAAESGKVAAVAQVWYGGIEIGYAVADVLFGDYNPSGRLAVSFPMNVGQLPISYNHFNTGRPHDDKNGFLKFQSCYLDVPNEPLYPFGYGLSYTTFDYSDISLSSNEMTPDGKITASVTVTNSGSREGCETVQLYIRDMAGSVVRPVKELKGFEKITLKPGESRRVDFTIDVEMLKFYNSSLEYVCEPGEFTVMIGKDSRDFHSAAFTLK